jgi:hypothetical protein
MLESICPIAYILQQIRCCDSLNPADPDRPPYLSVKRRPRLARPRCATHVEKADLLDAGAIVNTRDVRNMTARHPRHEMTPW